VGNQCSGMAGSLSEGSGTLIAGDVFSSGVRPIGADGVVRIRNAKLRFNIL
jgi:hypothetical protein